MDKDDAIRKVQALRKTAQHLATGAEESNAARGMAEKLVAKYSLTEEDLVEYEETTGFFGIRLDQDYHRRAAQYDRLKKEAQDSLYRLVAFLQDEENAAWRMESTYEQIDKQLQTAKAQFKQCDWCMQKGFGGKDVSTGLVTRHDLGWKTKSGRAKATWLHAACKKQLEDHYELQRKQSETSKETS